MEYASIGLGAALLAGLVSFLSPCVLPLIPAYLSVISGLTATELESKRPAGAVLVPSLLFVAGFSFVFVILGATASVLGALLIDYRVVLERMAGVLVIAFGVLVLGVFKMPWLYGESRFELGRARLFGRGAAFVMGAAFAFGWTPCVGPILGAILALAGSSASVGKGALLLLVYSLGLGIPFIVAGLLFGKFSPLLARLNRHALIVNRMAGMILIAVGVLLVTGQMARLVGALVRIVPPLSL